MILYNKPDLPIHHLLYSLFFFSSANKKAIEQWFLNYTGKKYCILVDSGKTALYSTYMALGAKGKVLVSPLTCHTSIMPMTSAGFSPRYVDIDIDTFNMDIKQLSSLQLDEVKAIQLIHLGGNPEKIFDIKSIIEKHGIPLIEDCAHGLGARFDKKNIGSFGDVSCFSFMKNIYGVGGGLVATDSKNIYESVSQYYNQVVQPKMILKTYRIINMILQKYSNFRLLEPLLKALRSMRDSHLSDEIRNSEWLTEKMSLFTYFEANIVKKQLDRLDTMIDNRKKNARYLQKLLKDTHGVKFQTPTPLGENVFTKLFLTTDLDSRLVINQLLNKNIEIRHLENRHHNIFPERFDKNKLLYDTSVNDCKNYFKIHDNLISLPLFPSMHRKELEFMASELQTVVHMNTKPGTESSQHRKISD